MDMAVSTNEKEMDPHYTEEFKKIGEAAWRLTRIAGEISTLNFCSRNYREKIREKRQELTGSFLALIRVIGDYI